MLVVQPGNTDPISSGNAVHIHISSPGTVDQSQWADILSEQERARAGAFLFENDRNLYITSHVFLRKILSLYGEVEPEEWAFVNNPYGKPAIKNPDYEHLRFNLSHAHGLIACAVCYDRELGVDVEHIRELSDLTGLARYILSESEWQVFPKSKDKNEQLWAFFSYWTLKEAYVKACGEGLSIPLKSISFIPGSVGEWVYTLKPDVYKYGHMWMLRHAIFSEHLLALSVEKIPGEAPPVISLTNWDISRHSDVLSFNVMPG